MMGRAIANLDAPVTKGTSGILLIREKGAVRKMPQPYRCGCAIRREAKNS